MAIFFNLLILYLQHTVFSSFVFTLFALVISTRSPSCYPAFLFFLPFAFPQQKGGHAIFYTASFTISQYTLMKLHCIPFHPPFWIIFCFKDMPSIFVLERVLICDLIKFISSLVTAFVSLMNLILIGWQ